MAINLSWDAEKNHIVRFIYNGDASSDDLRTALNDCQTMMQSVTERVDIVIETEHMQQLPRNILSVTANFIREAPANLGLMVFIGDNTYIGSLVMTFWRVYRFESRHIAHVASLDDAYNAIAADRDEQSNT